VDRFGRHPSYSRWLMGKNCKERRAVYFRHLFAY
jgi:hypothetical protein